MSGLSSIEAHSLLQPDILMSIIRHCLDAPISFPPSSHDPRPRLMLVNTTWREAVLSPEFWDRIQFFARPFRSRGHQLASLQTVIQRSRSNRLTFKFLPDLMENLLTAYGPNLNDDSVYGAGVIDIVTEIIRPHAPRLEYFQCLLPSCLITRILSEICQGALSSLEAADFACFRSFENPISLVCVKVARNNNFLLFKSLPLLKKLSFYDTDGIHPLDLWLPWAKMTKLDFGSTILPPDIFRAIMFQTRRRLIDAFFSVQFDLFTAYLDCDDKVTMTSLERFRVRFLRLGLYPTFPLQFVLPRIQEFWVERAEASIMFDWNLRQWTSVLMSASQSLERLILMTSPCHPLLANIHNASMSLRRPANADLEDLFKSMPYLKGLLLPMGVHIHVETLNKIGQGILLPFCDTLEFTTGADPEIIIAMLVQRNNPYSSPSSPKTSRIEALTLIFPRTNRSKKKAIKRSIKSLKISKGYKVSFLRSWSGCWRGCCSSR